MKFYSEVTKKFYDTVEDCENAEVAVKKAQEEKELAKKKLSEARASRAKEVENLRKNMIAAQKAYKEALEAFVKDYGTYHFSTSSLDELPHLFDFLGF